MIELRQRSRSSSRSDGYARLNQEDSDDHYRPNTPHRLISDDDDDDDDDFLPQPIMKRMKFVPQPQSRFCAKFCFFFCLYAIIFLSVLAFLLSKESPYLRVDAKYSHNKSELLNGVNGAILMYIFCIILSAYMWKRPHPVEEITDPRFLD